MRRLVPQAGQRFGPWTSFFGRSTRKENAATIALNPTSTTRDRRTWLEAPTSIQSLSIGGARITDNDLGLKHVIQLKRLQRLYVARTNITDAGMAYVKGLSALEDFSLDGTKVTDGGLAAVPCLTNLHAMSLCNTNVSDAGLVHLKGSSKLQILDLRNTKVTHAGVQELQKSLPKLKISR